MADTTLDIAFWNYGRTRALVDGSVRIEGVDAHFHSGRIVTSIFEELIRRRAYDVSELGMTYLLRTVQSDEPPFLAIPAFPVRSFRHSAIYVNRVSGIQRPEDLAGKTVELAFYGHDAGVMPKGVLSDEFGVGPNQCRWVIGHRLPGDGNFGQHSGRSPSISERFCGTDIRHLPGHSSLPIGRRSQVGAPHPGW